MIATSGQSFTGLSPSSVLSESLGSKLRKRLDSIGSMEYRQTWKRMATRSGRLYWAHTASGRRTSDNASSGWPTPTVDDANNVTRASGQFQSLPRTAQLAGWPTPTSSMVTEQDLAQAMTAGNGKDRESYAASTILSGWPTPMAGTPAQNGNNAAGSTDAERKVEMLMGLRETVNGPKISGWATPRAEVAESCGIRHSRGVADTLSAQAGQDLKSSTAGTAKPAALNPDHSRWLMGFPAAWGYCGATAMQSSRKSRRSSSVQPPI